MKRFIKIISLLVIILLINSSSFAEPLKAEVNNKLEKIEVKYIEELESSNSDKENPGYLFKSYQANWHVLIAESKDLVRFQSDNKILEGRENLRVIYLSIDMEEPRHKFEFISQSNSLLVAKDWGGKDRIVSLDLFEEFHNDILRFI